MPCWRRECGVCTARLNTSCSIFRKIFYKRCMWNGSGSNVDNISQPPSGWGAVCLDGMENHFGNASQAQYKSFSKSTALGLKHGLLSL